MGLPFIVFAQTAIAIHPAKTALDNPALRQQLEALGLVGTLDNLHAKPTLPLHFCLPCPPFKTTIGPYHL